MIAAAIIAVVLAILVAIVIRKDAAEYRDREPMDALSNRSTVRDVVLKFPIQFGKAEVAVNWLGYIMDHHPGPVMVCLPGEVSMNKWIEQKLNPISNLAKVVA